MQSKSSVEKIDILKRRASRIKKIRKYFEKQNVLEVDTPILSEKAVSDIHIESIGATVNNKQNFLHTSPEFCMKRILAMCSADIYQICKVFRDHEKGSLHSPEFTMVEWYRMNFTLQDIINDTCQLISLLLTNNQNKLIRDVWTYQDIFIHYLGIDPINDKTKEITKNFKFDKHFDEKSNMRLRGAPNISKKRLVFLAFLSWAWTVFAFLADPETCFFLYSFSIDSKFDIRTESAN